MNKLCQALLIFLSVQLTAIAGGDDHEHIVIRGAQVFNGCSADLIKADVLVSGNLISRIAPDVQAPEGATEIKADGYTLIPGLIDAHWHGVFATEIGRAHV